MSSKLLCSLLLSAVINLYVLPCRAQDDVQGFRRTQLSLARVSTAWNKYNDTLQKAFNRKGLAWPARDIFLRAFKSQNELELWARDSDTAAYVLVKTYRICAISGALGPKKAQGDRQVPEGFYFIDEFNPQSDYLLSLHISYPNYVDAAAGRAKPGGDIYIHGGCVTIGCLPLTNEGIEEVYTVCLQARINGREFIPVHIYPTHMSRSGISYLIREYAGKTEQQQFWAGLKNTYEYFEKYHKLLPVLYSPDGKYIN